MTGDPRRIEPFPYSSETRTQMAAGLSPARGRRHLIVSGTGTVLLR